MRPHRPGHPGGITADFDGGRLREAELDVVCVEVEQIVVTVRAFPGAEHMCSYVQRVCRDDAEAETI